MPDYQQHKLHGHLNPSKGFSECRSGTKAGQLVDYLVGAIHLKLNAHFTAGLVLPGSRVNKSRVLVICVIICHHDVQHHTWVGDLQVLALLGLELQI